MTQLITFNILALCIKLIENLRPIVGAATTQDHADWLYSVGGLNIPLTFISLNVLVARESYEGSVHGDDTNFVVTTLIIFSSALVAALFRCFCGNGDGGNLGFTDPRMVCGLYVPNVFCTTTLIYVLWTLGA